MLFKTQNLSTHSLGSRRLMKRYLTVKLLYATKMYT